MSALDQVALAWESVVLSLRQLNRPGLWVPWLILGTLQLVVVVALWGFAHPWVSGVMAPLLARLAGSDALHYPNIFRLIPGLYARADLVLGTLPGALALGASTALFAARFRGQPVSPGRALGAASRRAVALVLANLPFNLAVVALSSTLATIAARHGSALVQRAAFLATLGGAVLLQSLFLFINALVMIEGRGAFRALLSLPRTWARGFWAALFLGSLLLLPLLPLHLLSARGNLIVDRGIPELVGVLVLVQLAIALAVDFVLTSSATLVYLGVIAPRDEPA